MPDSTTDAVAALEALESVLRGLSSAVVAVSGGVDSAVVLAAAARAVPRVVAATGTSPAYAQRDLEAADDVARRVGVPHVAVATRETTDPRYAVNSPQRCFHCKHELYGKLWEVAQTHGLDAVLDGTHAEDTGDFRPGMRAADLLAVRSPLREAGLGKVAVRAIAQHLDLPVWDKPASPCLASRFPYGEAITLEKLELVDRAEECLRAFGFRQFRVRHHGPVARIEVPPSDLPRLCELGAEVTRALRALGYQYVTADLQGFRSGALNEVLTVAERRT